MFAPRARLHHDENAIQTRTPGPSTMQGRHQLSPIRGHLTTAGKQRQKTLGDGVGECLKRHIIRIQKLMLSDVIQHSESQEALQGPE